MKFAKWSVILLLSASMWGQAAPKAKAAGRTKKRVTPVAAKKTTAKPATASEIQNLRDTLSEQQRALTQQQQQLQQLRDELARKDESIRQAAAAASEAQTRVTAVETKANDAAPATAVETLKSDVADLKQNQANIAVSSQEDQKRVEAAESLLSRFRLSGDVRVRYENFFQSYTGCLSTNCADRHRERMRLRLGVEGNLAEDLSGGVYLATGDSSDPVSTNQTFNGFFTRKGIGFDRGWITYNPQDHKWLELTAGKFAPTWIRTPMTLDGDLNPEGFSQKFSFNLPYANLKNITFTGVELIANGDTKSKHAFAAGGQVSSKLQFGRLSLAPSFMLLNWHNADSVLNAITAKTLTGKDNYTNAVTPDGKRYLSQFLYADTILDAAIRTNWSRFPVRIVADYVNNLNANTNARHGYWVETSIGQTKERGDMQFGYTFARIEQDAVLAAFNESDLRAPTNVLQNRVLFNYTLRKNTTLGYTLWLGRTLNRNLQNAALAKGLAAGAMDPQLARMQFDVVYKF